MVQPHVIEAKEIKETIRKYTVRKESEKDHWKISGDGAWVVIDYSNSSDNDALNKAFSYIAKKGRIINIEKQEAIPPYEIYLVYVEIT
jgi:hypothetical protein